MSNTTPFAAPISATIWDAKYRLKALDGTPIDVTVEDTWRRIAASLASVEADPATWEKHFYEAWSDFRFLPAGRITAGAGTGRAVTLLNCFVLGTIPDSMPGIFDALKDAALTMQQGGGIGHDFSTLRPAGAVVAGVGADASGPLSFMDVWDAMCRTIMSAGSRRGAMMATLRCDHPDIEAFIEAKRNPSRLRNFNLSVLVTDPFMAAVRDDGPWDLVFGGKVYRTVQARALWDKIMRSTYEFAEPGVIFIDRINQRNPLRYIETICSTNPCGEQPLPSYGACLLGSINLARLVANPFQDDAHLDLEQLERLVATAVRMMDNVIDASNFPLPQQAEEARGKRRIGLGVTGLADALLMLRHTYGTEAAARKTEAWMKAISPAAYRASVALAKEKGAFPLFDADGYLASPTIQALDPDLQAEIRQHGIRNALLTSIAPTGTISLYAGNVSSGIEPVFAYAYTRKVLQPDGSKTEEEVVDYAVKLYRDKWASGEISHGFDAPPQQPWSDSLLPDYFVSAQTLSPQAHVRMQAAAQKWVDSSISKTINCPEDISFDDFKDVYLAAWDMGCKGCTTYRPNAITGSVLSVEPSPKKEDPKAANPAASGAPVAPVRAPLDQPMPRADILSGQTYKLKWAGKSYYITVNDIADAQGRRRPFEVFINTKNIEAQSWIAALTLMVSAVFRRGGDVSFVAEELKGVFDARGGEWVPGKGYVKSLVAAIGDILEQHMHAIGFLEPQISPEENGVALRATFNAAFGTGQPVASTASAAAMLAAPPRGAICPSCAEPTLIKSSGCDQCCCGYSKCS